ncbi:MAG: hypothetical protein ABMA25_20330 [Ilumatobacteraceae bacterium]
MNEECERLWRARRPPFDGVTIRSSSLHAEQLFHLLREVVPLLLGGTGLALTTFLDWHEHDGYVTRSEAVDQRALLDAVSTFSRFLDASSDDTFVRRAWYSAGRPFLLRWCVSSWPEDFAVTSGLAGNFDVTGSSELVQLVADLVPDSTQFAAGDFFDATWAG